MKGLTLPRSLAMCLMSRKVFTVGAISDNLLSCNSVCNQQLLKLSNRTVPISVSERTILKLCGNTRNSISTTLYRQFRLDSQARVSTPLIKGTGSRDNDKLISEMNIRLVNENSFLSWCRNAYLSTVVGVAMITEGTTALAQGAGAGALLVGSMNLIWGTGCHLTNLIRLRHVSGMSGLTLILHLLGSFLHCLLWAFVLVCYVGFLDETNSFGSDPSIFSEGGEGTSMYGRKQGLDVRAQTRGVSDV